jgi:hypothetical protein
MKKLLFILLLFTANSLASTKIIVPFIPGGSVDLLARKFVQYIEINSNFKFSIENEGGAGSLIGTTQFIKSRPNSLLITSSSWYINIVENKFKLSDFSPVSILAESPMFLMVNKNQNLTCERIKKSEINYFIGAAKGQTSTVVKLLHDQFNHIIEVPYRGVKQSVLDLLGNQINGAIIAGATDLQEPLILLANTTDHTINGVPSFKECFGIEKTANSQFLLIAGPNSDPEFIDQINALSKTFVEASDTKKYYIENNLYPKVTGIKETNKNINLELINWKNLLK